MRSQDFDIYFDPMNLAEGNVYSVTQVTRRIKTIIESQNGFLAIRIRGEVTNLSKSKAGHIYFGLKDETSYIRCVAFKGDAIGLKVKPEEGREIIAGGRITVWEAGGTYQLIVEQIEEVGMGALWLQFEELKKKLAAEGLFDERLKRPLPSFPELIGIVTSLDGAALRDILRIFSERAPYLKIIISPSLVQGENAPKSLIRAIDLLEMWNEIELKKGKRGLDLIIIGRGGGSFEDLACFNDEALARRIRATKVPVISAVGHEVDFTICDFVSDVRAATPTQAAVLAAPSIQELMTNLESLLAEFRLAAGIKVETYRTGLDNLLSRLVFRRPMDWINTRRLNLDSLFSRATRSAINSVKLLRQKIEASINHLAGLNPESILARGYSLAFNAESGKLISRTAQAPSGTKVDLRVSDGIIKLTADEVRKKK